MAPASFAFARDIGASLACGTSSWHMRCFEAVTHSARLMRLQLLTVSLIVSLAFTGCADHAARIVAGDTGTQPPIGPSDGSTVGGGGSTGGSTGGNTGGGAGGTTPSPGDGAADGSAVDGGGEGGGPGGSPVPEPGTMLLVGTGLAGAALMRRRRQTVKVETEQK